MLTVSWALYSSPTLQSRNGFLAAAEVVVAAAKVSTAQVEAAVGAARELRLFSSSSRRRRSLLTIRLRICQNLIVKCVYVFVFGKVNSEYGITSLPHCGWAVHALRLRRGRH